jgi:hypothetical protein
MLKKEIDLSTEQTSPEESLCEDNLFTCLQQATSKGSNNKE